MTFLAARALPSPAVAILGVPFDATSTFRAGSAHAPDAIRWASQSIETYSPVQRRDLEGVSFADLGNLDISGLGPEGVVDALRARLGAMPSSTLPLVLGGEHTITLGAVTAAHQRYPGLAVLQLDAHTDLRNEYEDRSISHATVMRRILDEVGGDDVVQVGVRAGTREEFEMASTLRFTSPRLAIPPAVWTWLEQRPVYITLDIDVVDPAEAPGTGNPEPEGVAAADLLAFVRRLGQLRVVVFDLVEVSPPYDPSGRTVVLAATIVREAILAIAGRSDVGRRS